MKNWMPERDRFAAAVIAGAWAGKSSTDWGRAGAIASFAYEVADAMCDQRGQGLFEKFATLAETASELPRLFVGSKFEEEPSVLRFLAALEAVEEAGQ